MTTGKLAALAVAAIAACGEAAQADVYGIADPAERLAAIRAKWPNAADRVSQWAMPDLEERFFEIDELQDWCEEDPENRYAQFEEACRDAIAMKMEPAVWFYNLACALAVQGKPKEEVFDALEQAVAAGFNKPNGAMSDADFRSVTNDVRFAKLCEAMGQIKESWNMPRKELDERDAECALSEDNVYYVFKDSSYQCYLASTSDWPVVYLNHHVDHAVIPCEGMVVPKFPREAVEAGRSRGPANMYFINHGASDQRHWGRFCPTIVASDWTYGNDSLNGTVSIPAMFGMDRECANNEGRHCWDWNCLGIYSAASDYGADGIDRFMGWFPLCIAHAGGADEADKFVRLCRDMIAAMSPAARGVDAMLALNVIRHAQKCVKSEDDFMSGIAQRPVLKFSDIDAAKAVELVRRVNDLEFLPPNIPAIKTYSVVSEGTRCTDLWEPQFSAGRLGGTPFCQAHLARQAEKTASLRVEMAAPRSGALVWKSLQGEKGKVRIVPQNEDKSIVVVEVDWHNVFDVPLPDGTRIKSSRVDVGCFCVLGGKASLPAVVSFYFNPNETREYGADGKLASIDYTKRQLDGYCPSLCPKGDWRDELHWNAAGELTGWTRFCADGEGRVTTNEFTREGLIVDTRDALGRPKDVHRSFAATWKQNLDPQDLTNEVKVSDLGYYGSQFDKLKDPPEGLAIAWKYEYADDADQFGKLLRKEPVPFRYRPELCLRADFAAESGFRLPLIDQMELGYYVHVGYRHDSLEWFDRADELMRDDARYALAAQGLKQPETLKKMEFCPWKPRTNDAWRVDTATQERKWQDKLMEMADGVYRMHAVGDDGGDIWPPVSETYWMVNWFLEMDAYEQLDAAYRRCGEEEVRKVLSVNVKSEAWAETMVVEDGYVRFAEVPKGKSRTLAMWRIGDGLYFGISAAQRVPKGPRQYFFRRVDREIGEPLEIYCFRELPSPAIGNAVLGADAGDAEALNNLAVLLYAGVANPDEYCEAAVARLLRRAYALGCAQAGRNLGVLRYNRGEQRGR